MQSIPHDPMSGKKDWRIVEGADPNSTVNAYGIKDVRSASRLTSMDGTPYDEW